MDKVDIKMLFDKKQEEMLAKFNLSSLLGHPVSKEMQLKQSGKTGLLLFSLTDIKQKTLSL